MTPPKKFLSLPSLFVFVVLACADPTLVLTAAEVQLAWDANPEPDIAGYRVHYGVSPGVYTESEDVGTSTTANVTGLDVDTTYYFVVTAYNTAALVSLPSNGVSTMTSDTLAPLVNLTTGTQTVTGEFSVAVDFSEPVTGLDLGDFAVVGGVASSVSGGSSNYSASIAPDTPGTVTVSLPSDAAHDAAGNGNLSSNTLGVSFEPPPDGNTPVAPTSESTQRGSTSGTLADVAESDGIYEAFTEVSSGGKPANRFSQLQHTWTFDISGANPVLHVEAFHSPSADDDDFVFSYSVNGSTSQEVLTVTKTSDDDVAQTVALGDASGTIVVRVDDTNHLAGTDSHFDTLYIDHLAIYSSTNSPGSNTAPSFHGDPLAESDAVVDKLYGSTLADDVSDADGDVLTFSKTTGPAWLNIAADGTLGGVPSAADLGENAFTVEADDGRGGKGSSTLLIRVVPVSGTLDLFVAGISLEPLAHGGNRHSVRASVTILDQTGAPVSGATVSGTWSGASDGSDSGVTGTNAVATLRSDRVKNGGVFTITIASVSAQGFNYNPTLNTEVSDSVSAP